MTEPVIAVHGGAGAWTAGHDEAAAALEAALRDGEAALREAVGDDVRVAAARSNAGEDGDAVIARAHAALGAQAGAGRT